MIAAIKIRGTIDAQQGVKDTLQMLNLNKKHSAVVVEDNPVNRGMLRKCKDFITYGEVSEDMAKKVEDLYKGDNAAHLHPPRGGLKSIKRPFARNGDLGDRGEEMEKLIQRMLP